MPSKKEVYLAMIGQKWMFNRPFAVYITYIFGRINWQKKCSLNWLGMSRIKLIDHLYQSLSWPKHKYPFSVRQFVVSFTPLKSKKLCCTENYLHRFGPRYHNKLFWFNLTTQKTYLKKKWKIYYDVLLLLSCFRYL